MRRDWTNVGLEVCPLDHRETFGRYIDAMRWIDLGPSGHDGPMMPLGEISECIQDLRIPKVDRISYDSRDLAPYGLYGVRGTYKNARVTVYIVSRGHDCIPVCMDVEPRPVTS